MGSVGEARPVCSGGEGDEGHPLWSGRVQGEWLSPQLSETVGKRC